MPKYIKTLWVVQWVGRHRKKCWTGFAEYVDAATFAGQIAKELPFKYNKVVGPVRFKYDNF